MNQYLFSSRFDKLKNNKTKNMKYLAILAFFVFSFDTTTAKPNCTGINDQYVYKTIEFIQKASSDTNNTLIELSEMMKPLSRCRPCCKPVADAVAELDRLLVVLNNWLTENVIRLLDCTGGTSDSSYCKKTKEKFTNFISSVNSFPQ